jgi:putative ABC transport system substrate-binding protein
MIDRKRFLTQLMVGALAPLNLHAQPDSKVARIGFLSPTSEPNESDVNRMQTLLSVLRELGWTRGRNLLVEIRHAGLDPQRQRAFAAQLKAVPVALIIAYGTVSIRAAHEGAPSLPIVMINAGDPVGSGFVANLAKPGGDLTGTSAAGAEVIAKQLELLSSAAPRLTRVSVLMNPVNPINGFLFGALSSRARTLGLQLDRIDVTTADELEAAIARAQGGALLVVGDPMFGLNRARIAQLALRFRVPSMFGFRAYVVDGGLMSYLSSDAWHWRTAASFVDKILRGARPGDLPIEQPTQFELTLNSSTAKALGLTLPRSLLLRADEVIQ